MVKAIVRKGRSVVLGGEERTTALEGQSIELPKGEFERLSDLGFVTKPGSEEAKVAKVAADAIPADFPGHDALVAGEITTLAQLREVTDEELVALEGIGAKTVEKIRAELAEE